MCGGHICQRKNIAKDWKDEFFLFLPLSHVLSSSIDFRTHAWLTNAEKSQTDYTTALIPRTYTSYYIIPLSYIQLYDIRYARERRCLAELVGVQESGESGV